MRTLSIDIETFSDIDIELGVYKYCDTPNFTILLIAYSFDDEEVKLIDVEQGDEVPKEFIKALTDEKVLKKAYNAQFERVCMTKYFDTYLDSKQWWCTMIHSAMLGLPGRLADVAETLNLEEQKDTAGVHLINYFSKPCKPTRTNGNRTRNRPHHDLDKWYLFKKYCIQDVITEKAIAKYLEDYPISDKEKALYHLDQKINDFGIGVDLQLVDVILKYYEKHASDLLEESANITGLDNVNSRDQLLEWLQGQGLKIDNIRKATLESVLENEDLKPHIRTVIENRLETGKASVKKYQMLHDATCNDGRIRGTLQFYGANRTGRFAGRLVQVQNLSRIYLKEIDALRILVKNKDFKTLEMLYDSPSSIFSQLIRTCFVPTTGYGNDYAYAVADYSSIEARIIAWLADEKWVMDVFANNGDIYRQTASNMFNIPLEEIDKPLRQKGKISVLALGYGGSVAALKAMGALNMGIEEEELPGLVKSWRKANKKIVRLWSIINDLATDTVENYNVNRYKDLLEFRRDDTYFFIKLPSGRELAYLKPRLKEDRYGYQIEYLGKESGRVAYTTNRTYGGKLVENIVQAIARDCLCESLHKLDHNNYRIAFHVHDEVVVEVLKEDKERHLEIIKDFMGEPIDWAPGLYLTAEGFTSDYYTKD